MTQFSCLSKMRYKVTGFLLFILVALSSLITAEQTVKSGGKSESAEVNESAMKTEFDQSLSLELFTESDENVTAPKGDASLEFFVEKNYLSDEYEEIRFDDAEDMVQSASGCSDLEELVDFECEK
ncbi:MAG: hypothetical protein HQM10_12905 [Candidatus Riflebacteria bacterium]|nr:hypothetical protein [Candidatus Riflebacteria bacterium]